MVLGFRIYRVNIFVIVVVFFLDLSELGTARATHQSLPHHDNSSSVTLF